MNVNYSPFYRRTAVVTWPVPRRIWKMSSKLKQCNYFLDIFSCSCSPWASSTQIRTRQISGYSRCFICRTLISDDGLNVQSIIRIIYLYFLGCWIWHCIGYYYYFNCFQIAGFGWCWSHLWYSWHSIMSRRKQLVLLSCYEPCQTNSHWKSHTQIHTHTCRI